MEQFKLRLNDESIRPLFSTLLETYESGACFIITDLSNIIYKKAYKFDIPEIVVGTPFKQEKMAGIVINEKKVIKQKIESTMYGVPSTLMGGPLWSDDLLDIVGTWGMLSPREHPLISAFHHFAPKMMNSLPEGGIAYITDKNTVLQKQGSKKFDVDLKVGDPGTKLPVAQEVIRTGKQDIREVPASYWGKALYSVCDPVIDEETNEVIAAFGLGLPRELPQQLKLMANNLGEGLEQVSATMEEIASSSSEIMSSQSSLHSEISLVQQLSKQIDEVVNFIKDIANETNMLGLNAAIEAARAGDFGKGFGVVAEHIRKLSEDSKQSVVEIKELTTKIQTAIENTIVASKSTLKNTEEEAAATEEISASILEISNMAQDLDKIAEQL